MTHFEAFKAGFYASEEAFNGERIHPAFDTPPLVEQEIRRRYAEWMKTTYTKPQPPFTEPLDLPAGDDDDPSAP